MKTTILKAQQYIQPIQKSYTHSMTASTKHLSNTTAQDAEPRP
ncbi:MAG: hypothetical protein N2234_00480 [Planctomycetota bacterium]|nr:hypothetical protein [Planctomycetota bacterium]